MNNIQIFENENFGNVRILKVDDKILFCGSDVAKLLGYNEPHKAVSWHCKGAKKYHIPTSGGKQNVIFITEQEVFYLIQSCKTITKFKKSKIIEWLKQINLVNVNFVPSSRNEIEFMSELKDFLAAMNLELKPQYNVLGFKIDGYIPELNIAIEYDEKGHSNYSYDTQEGRQAEIENEIGCKFVRLSENNSNAYNVGVVANKIMDVKRNE